MNTKQIVVGEIPVMVELAVARDDRDLGLMFRELLPEDAGMLFIFPDDRALGFWMKSTRIALTIAYLDSAGYILELHDAEPLDETPIVAGQPCRYALEMNRGWFARHGIEVGAQVVL